MTPVSLQAVGDGGLLGAAAQAATLAGTLVLALILVGFATVAYKHVRGDGIEWPDDDGDDAAQGGSDDEWKYY